MLDKLKVQVALVILARMNDIDTKLSMIYVWLSKDYINLPEFKVLVIAAKE